MAKQLTRLCATSDVEEGGVFQASPVDTFDEFAVYLINGNFYVTDDQCTHGMVSLSQGDIEDEFQIFCPLHGGAFDIRTGEATELPCRIALKTYKPIIQDGSVFIELEL